MAKNTLPSQKYELINVSKMGIANGTPLVCEHCGRVIFNIATLKGEDGKEYSVGLTCLKKIIKKNSDFLSVEDTMKMEQQEIFYNQGANALKWLKKTMAEYDERGVQYKLEVVNFKDGDFWINAKLTAKYRMYHEGMNLFHTASLKPYTLPMFNEILQVA